MTTLKLAGNGWSTLKHYSDKFAERNRGSLLPPSTFKLWRMPSVERWGLRTSVVHGHKHHQHLCDLTALCRPSFQIRRTPERAPLVPNPNSLTGHRSSAPQPSSLRNPASPTPNSTTIRGPAAIRQGEAGRVSELAGRVPDADMRLARMMFLSGMSWNRSLDANGNWMPPGTGQGLHRVLGAGASTARTAVGVAGSVEVSSIELGTTGIGFSPDGQFL